jgi:uncharacterized protein (TIGR03435 family)
MTQFTQFLARFFPGRTVLDETGLEGNYRFSLNFALRSDTGETFSISDEVSSAVKSLGLKIESRNEPLKSLWWIVLKSLPPIRRLNSSNSGLNSDTESPPLYASR